MQQLEDDLQLLSSEVVELKTSLVINQSEITQLRKDYLNKVFLSEQSNYKNTKLIEEQSKTEGLALEDDNQKTELDITEDNTTEKPDDVSEPSNSDTLTRFAEKMMNEPDYDPVKHISSQFAEQERDPSWSSTYEYNVTELFSSNIALSSMVLDRVNCKSTICEVVVYAEQGSFNNVGALLLKSLSEQKWHDKKAGFVFNNNSEDGETTFYFGRDENSLSF